MIKQKIELFKLRHMLKPIIKMDTEDPEKVRKTLENYIFIVSEVAAMIDTKVHQFKLSSIK